MPHPLPDDVGGVTGLRWFLVAVPDDPAYTRAAMDIYTDMANYWKWGKEGPVPTDSDLAAQHWANAIAETLEALEMGFPDILLGYINEVETLLRAIRDRPICCDNFGFEPVGGDENTGGATDVEDGVGDPPDTWGGDPVADWSEWDMWKCGAAKLFATLPAETMRGLDAISEHEGATGWSELVATALGYIPIAGTYAAMLWTWVVSILDAGLDWAVDFEGAALEIEAAADDIACAIFQADGVESAASAMQSAVQDAITGTLASTLAAYFPYQMWANIIYQGYFIDSDGNRVDLDTLVTPADDCCPPESGEIKGFAFTFTKYLLNGSTGSNTNIPTSSMSGATADYLQSSPASTVMATQANLTATNPWTSATGSGTALAAIVANDENNVTTRDGLDTVIRVAIEYINNSTGDASADIEAGAPQLYNNVTGEWVPANISLVSADEGWTVDGNNIDFFGIDLPNHTPYRLVVDMTYQ